MYNIMHIPKNPWIIYFKSYVFLNITVIPKYEKSDRISHL
jgi:hypothetical protein